MLPAWFQEDDYDILLHVVRGGPFGMWTFGPSNFFRPLISVTFWAQHQIWGMNPLPYRLFNDSVHALVAVMVGLLARELLVEHRRRDAIGVVAGLLFLLHPSHAEAVNWIAGRTDLCSALCGMASLVLFARYARVEGRWDLVGAYLAFALGLLCKESVVLVPFMAVFVARRHWRALAGFFPILVGYAALRFELMGPALKGNLERSQGMKLVGTTVVQLARMVLPGLPFGDPDMNNVQTIRTAPGLAYLVIGLALLIGAFVMARRSIRWAPVGMGLLALAPALGLSVREFRSQGERFVYLPSVFVAIAFAVAIFEIWPRRGVVAGWLVAGLAAACLQWQNVYWLQAAKDSRLVQDSIVRDVLPKVPPGTKEIVFTNLPERVQGGYSIAMALDSLVPLVSGREMHVDVKAVEAIVGGVHRSKAQRQGGKIIIESLDGNGSYSLEDSFLAQVPDEAGLRARGYLQFRPDRLVLVADRRPTFYWNGERFLPL